MAAMNEDDLDEPLPVMRSADEKAHDDVAWFEREVARVLASQSATGDDDLYRALVYASEQFAGMQELSSLSAEFKAST